MVNPAVLALTPPAAPATVDQLLEALAERLAPPAALLDRKGAAAFLGLSLPTFDRERAAGRVGPRPVNLAGPKWHRDELVEWLLRRDPAGELLDCATWATVWSDLQRRKR